MEQKKNWLAEIHTIHYWQHLYSETPHSLKPKNPQEQWQQHSAEQAGDNCGVVYDRLELDHTIASMPMQIDVVSVVRRYARLQCAKCGVALHVDCLGSFHTPCLASATVRQRKHCRHYIFPNDQRQYPHSIFCIIHQNIDISELCNWFNVFTADIWDAVK